MFPRERGVLKHCGCFNFFFFFLGGGVLFLDSLKDRASIFVQRYSQEAALNPAGKPQT